MLVSLSSMACTAPEVAVSAPTLAGTTQNSTPTVLPRPEVRRTPDQSPVRRQAGVGAPAVMIPGVPSVPPAWIDPYEVTVRRFKACVDAHACRPEQFTVEAGSMCNYGEPSRSEHPMNCVSWHGANAFCRFAGGRLCRESEWFAACRGPQQRNYPYGSQYQEGACRARIRAIDNSPPQGTAPVGETSGCEGGYPGLTDMVGNVAEWVDSCDGDYCHFYGGAFLDSQPIEAFASCQRFCAGNQKTFRSITIGLRCCYDVAP